MKASSRGPHSQTNDTRTVVFPTKQIIHAVAGKATRWHSHRASVRWRASRKVMWRTHTATTQRRCFTHHVSPHCLHPRKRLGCEVGQREQREVSDKVFAACDGGAWAGARGRGEVRCVTIGHGSRVQLCTSLDRSGTQKWGSILITPTDSLQYGKSARPNKSMTSVP